MHAPVGPNSRKGKDEFMKYFISFHILRLFRKRREAMASEALATGEVLREFPSQNETAIRKSMKEVATFRRGQDDFGGANVWLRRDDDHTEESIRSRHDLTPENVCLYESMQAAQCRLSDLGIRRLDIPTAQITKALDFQMKSLRLAEERLKKEKERLKKMQKIGKRSKGPTLDGERSCVARCCVAELLNDEAF